MNPSATEARGNKSPAPPPAAGPESKGYLRKGVEYLGARYLVDPLRGVVRQARRRFSYIDRVMDQVLLARTAGTGKANRILDAAARLELTEALRRVSELAPEAVAKGPVGADLRQAFLFDRVKAAATRFASPRILFLSSGENAAVLALARLGHQIHEISVGGNDLASELSARLAELGAATFDIVCCTSLLERVGDDEALLGKLVDLLAPAGMVIGTCEFLAGYRPGAPTPAGRQRLYTKSDLLNRLARVRQDCDLVDAPAWDGDAPELESDGVRYGVATFVLRRGQNLAFGVRFETLSLSEQARFFDDNGFLIVPAALSPTEVDEALGDLETYGLKGTTEEIWKAPSARALVDNPKLVAPLRATFGDDIRFVKGAYVESLPDQLIPPERQRRYLHVDYGIGETWGDFRNSTPAWVNVGIYLTGLTEEHSPLWVVPGSHRKMSVIPNTAMEYLAPEAKRVIARPGDAVIFHCRCVHAASYNRSDRSRHTYFYQYRPAWAKPAGTVPEWPEAFINSFPEEVRRMLVGLNGGL